MLKTQQQVREEVADLEHGNGDVEVFIAQDYIATQRKEDLEEAREILLKIATEYEKILIDQNHYNIQNRNEEIQKLFKSLEIQ